MSYEAHSVQKIRLITEAAGASTFAIDQTSSPGLASFIALAFVEGTAELVLGQDVINPEIAQQRRDDMALHVLGRKFCSLSLTVPLAPTGTAASDGVVAVQGGVGRILSAVMGGEQLGTGSIVAAGTSASQMDVSAGDGANILGGTAIGVDLGTGGTANVEYRPVDTRSTDTLTLKLALSEAPAVSDNVYASATYYLTDRTTNTTKSLQFVVEGAEETDRWLLLGCQCTSWSIELPMDGFPRMTMTFEGATWLHGASGETAVQLTDTTLTEATYTNHQNVIVLGGAFYQWTNGTTTYSATTSRLNVASEAWSPGINYIRQMSPHGVQNTLGWVRGNAKPVISGTFNIPFEDMTWFTARSSRTTKGFVRQFGTTPGYTVLLEAPSTQVVNVQRVNEAGLAYQQVSWVGRCDDDTGGSTDLQLSAFRIHLL